MILAKKLIPLGNKILVLPEPKKDKTDSGIIIVETAQNADPQYGEVVATGMGNTVVNEDATGYVIIPLEVQVGDRVLYAPNDYPAIDRDGKVCLLMTCDQILCKEA